MQKMIKGNKKAVSIILAFIMCISCLVGVISVVHAQGTEDKATQTSSEIKVIYQFADGKVYKEFSVYFEKGYVLDASELEMLPDDMKFNDEFLFYEVKGDGTDKIVRIVENIEKEKSDVGTQTDEPDTSGDNPDISDKETQTDNPNTNDTGTQTEDVKTEDKETQTDLTADEIEKSEDKIKNLEEKIEKLISENDDKNKQNESQKDEIDKLKEEIKDLEEKLKNKNDSDFSKEKNALQKQIESLESKIAGLQTDINNGKGDGVVTKNITEGTKENSYSVNDKGGSSFNGKTNVDKNEDEQIIRYPNKLTPKPPANNTQNADGTTNNQNTNKGVASDPSKARGTVTENVDNANDDYPIHHGDETDDMASDMYSADARQFITFQTKNGKTFHLIINHDEQSENVLLLTEVSEDDLLNMVERKEEPEKEEVVIQKETKEPEEQPKKEEEKKSDLGTYILLALVIAGALGAGYYFKVVKSKERKELEDFEEEDDFFSEAEEYEESDEISEAEEITDTEEYI